MYFAVNMPKGLRQLNLPHPTGYAHNTAALLAATALLTNREGLTPSRSIANQALFLNGFATLFYSFKAPFQTCTPAVASATAAYQSLITACQYSTPKSRSSTFVFQSLIAGYGSLTPAYQSLTSVYRSSTPVSGSSAPAFRSLTSVPIIPVFLIQTHIF